MNGDHIGSVAELRDFGIARKSDVAPVLTRAQGDEPHFERDAMST